MGNSVEQGNHLSVQQNPVRLTSDAEDLNSEDDLQLAHELGNELRNGNNSIYLVIDLTIYFKRVSPPL